MHFHELGHPPGRVIVVTQRPPLPRNHRIHFKTICSVDRFIVKFKHYNESNDFYEKAKEPGCIIANGCGRAVIERHQSCVVNSTIFTTRFTSSTALIRIRFNVHLSPGMCFKSNTFPILSHVTRSRRCHLSCVWRSHRGAARSAHVGSLG